VTLEGDVSFTTPQTGSTIGNAIFFSGLPNVIGPHSITMNSPIGFVFVRGSDLNVKSVNIFANFIDLEETNVTTTDGQIYVATNTVFDDISLGSAMFLEGTYENTGVGAIQFGDDARPDTEILLIDPITLITAGNNDADDIILKTRFVPSLFAVNLNAGALGDISIDADVRFGQITIVGDQIDLASVETSSGGFQSYTGNTINLDGTYETETSGSISLQRIGLVQI